jgi:Mg-chelatase subunit ChlD
MEVLRMLRWMMVLTIAGSMACGEYSSEGGDGVPSLSGADDRGGEGGDPDTCTSGPCGEPIPAGQLTAGEWRDLDDWDRWMDLVDGEFATDHAAWGANTTERFPVRVSDAGRPVVDARVALLDAEGRTEWEARTDAQGEAELFAGMDQAATGPFTVEVRSGSAAATQTIEPSATATELELSGSLAPRRALDLMFVIDTTGSMGDELRYIQAELADVIARSQANASQRFDLRVSMSFYRDEGDDYVVRSNDFTTDVDQALRQLSRQSAGGGGNWPEAVDQALEDAIAGHEWSDDAAARLLFLVLDAPPHSEQRILARVRDATRGAAERGVRIVPVSGSGIQKSTEVLLRSLGILTGGTYVFLTNDSGIGGDHIEPTVGAFQVEFLNDLMARLIVESVDGRPTD